MRRRAFIAGLGSAAAWPVAVRAQQPKMPVIGLFGSQFANDYKSTNVPFFQSLKETGYAEGQNVAVENRYAENQMDRLPSLAADLVRRRVAVIVASGAPAALAAKSATTTMPILFGTGGDPVALGLVASLNRPGANVTGHAVLVSELLPKQLQLLSELLPNAAVFSVLVDSAFPDTQYVIADLQAARRTLDRQLVVVGATTDSDLETAFTTFSQQRVGAVLVGQSAFYNQRTEQLVDNLKTAKALGLTIPETLLADPARRSPATGIAPCWARARLAFNSFLRVPEPTATSNRPSQLCRNSALVRSWSATIPSTTGAQKNLRRWRLAMRCPRCSHTVSTPWWAA